MKNDKALTPAELELTQKIQLHFPREIDPSIINRWNGLSAEVLQRTLHSVFSQFPGPLVTVNFTKFALLVDLGIITVPEDYDHETQLAKFKERYQGDDFKTFLVYSEEITDANFSNPTRTLHPGERLRVQAFKQIVSGATTYEERMEFLATQKAVYVGAQGASLVFTQKHSQLWKGVDSYASLDKKDRLLKDCNGIDRVPTILLYSGGGSGPYYTPDSFGFAHCSCDGVCTFLCFTEVEEEEKVA